MTTVSEAALAYALSLAEGSPEASSCETAPSSGQLELETMERRFSELEQRMEEASSPAKHVVHTANRTTHRTAAEGSAVSEALACVQAQDQAAAVLAVTLAEAQRAAKSSGGDATVFHLGSPEAQPLPEISVGTDWPEMSGAMQKKNGERAADWESMTVLTALLCADQGQTARTPAAAQAKETPSAPSQADKSHHEQQPLRQSRTQDELKAMYEQQKAGEQMVPQQATNDEQSRATGYAVLCDFDFAGTDPNEARPDGKRDAALAISVRIVLDQHANAGAGEVFDARVSSTDARGDVINAADTVFNLQ